jgi:hypothetical protein
MRFSPSPQSQVAWSGFTDNIKVGEAAGFSVAGFGLQDVTPQTAMKNGNIQKPIGT